MLMPMAFLGGWGTNELLIVLGVALLIFGGKKLPELARSLGKSINEFRRGIREVSDGIRDDSEPRQLEKPREEPAGEESEDTASEAPLRGSGQSGQAP